MKNIFLIVSVLALPAMTQELDLDESIDLNESGKGATCLFAEAEDFSLGVGWTRRQTDQFKEMGKVGPLWPWYKDVNKSPRVASGLEFASGDAGKAIQTFKLSESRKWRLWVCFGANSGPFVPSVLQKGRILASGTRYAVRRPDSALWTWGAVDFEAEGDVSVELAAKGAGAMVDCVIVTDDLKYEPDVRDFHRFFVRLRLGKDNKSPIMFPGGWHQPNFAMLKPGAASPWIDLTKRFHYGITEGISFSAVPKKPQLETDYEVDFSWDGKTPFATWRHDSLGTVVRGLFSLAQKGLVSDVEMSAANLKLAQAVSKKPARMPKRFGVSSTLAVDWENWSPATVRNEIEVFRILGLNGVGGRLQAEYAPPADFTEAPEFVIDHVKGCLCTPDIAALEKIADKMLLRNKAALDAGKTVAWGIMDEVLWGMNKVLACKSTEKNCMVRFREFVKAKGYDPSDLGVASWDEVVPIKDYKAGLRYYLTAAYRDQVIASFFRTLTDICAKRSPLLLPTANMGTELTWNGNLLQGGMNLFELCDSRSMRHILTEDWANEQRTYQHCSYLCDVLRAAGRRSGSQSSMLNIISGRTAEEIAAKAFSEAGRGVKAISFFRYGPHYTGASDSSNQNPDIYPAIRSFCDALAPVEDRIMDGRVRKGDVALLLSVTGDRWQLLDKVNQYGKDRMALSLMLNHLSVRTDVLGEDDLFDQLKKYRQLFVCDRNIRRACVEPLCA